MEKTAYTIKMNYKNALKQADKLEELAKKLRKTAGTRLEECLKGVNKAWKSDSSARYIKKGRKLKEDLQKRADELDKSGETIRTIAKNIYEAEIRALKLAGERKHSI